MGRGRWLWVVPGFWVGRRPIFVVVAKRLRINFDPYFRCPRDTPYPGPWYPGPWVGGSQPPPPTSSNSSLPTTCSWTKPSPCSRSSSSNPAPTKDPPMVAIPAQTFFGRSATPIWISPRSMVDRHRPTPPPGGREYHRGDL